MIQSTILFELHPDKLNDCTLFWKRFYKTTRRLKCLLIVSLLMSGWMTSLYPGDPPLQDTTNHYFEDLTHLLSFKLFTLNKTSALDLINADKDRITLRPNGSTNLGVGFNNKFIGIAVSFGLPRAQSNIEKYGQTTKLDVQFSYYGKRIGLDGFLQGYKGYYMANPEDYIAWDNPYYPQNDDLQVISYGVNAFYLFNSKKFSYKAAYQRTMVQKKSAGSFSTGIFFHHDVVKSDYGLIPQEVSDAIWTDFDLKDFNAFSIGLSAGYQHTFVIKENFFISLQATPGLGYRRLSVESLDHQTGDVNELAWKFLARFSVGYEFKHFYVGAMGSTIFRNIEYNSYIIDLGTEQLRIIVGKRFDVNRKKP